MKASAVWIVAPNRVELREETLAPLGPEQVLVRTICSALSPGTERLFYAGELPAGTRVDEALLELDGELVYPLKYGYAAVGQVIELGSSVDPSWQNQRVFAFHPHQSAFNIASGRLIRLPSAIDAEQAAFLANVETALSLVHDGAPLAGEVVHVHGLGVVGLLTAALLSRFPLAKLVGIDPLPDRRRLAIECGVHKAIGPSDLPSADDGADLSFELSGSAAGLDQAIHATGFGGRVVIGSWYGSHTAELHLDTAFHRSRLRLICSQVSTLPASLSGRWSKDRRMVEALRLLPELTPARLVTHRIPHTDAGRAYRLLDSPDEAVGILLTYPPSD
jgi:2-desacetyl-2-hydroxyethyl bacteriochlorophyllide A dehydrogenase